MKKKNILILIILSIFMFIIIICLIIIMNKIDELSKEDKEIGLRTIESSNCNFRPSLYYDNGDYKVYTYCLDSISIIDDSIMELKEYLSYDENIFNKLFSKLSYTTYLDGGTREYKDYKITNITNNGITIIKCNGKGDMTNDIYIGPDSMKYKMNFCKKDNSTFIKSYKVLNVEENLLNEVVLTLDCIDTIERITLSTNYKFENNANYEFEFMGHEDEDEDNIKSIFEDLTIVEIRKK